MSSERIDGTGNRIFPAVETSLNEGGFLGVTLCCTQGSNISVLKDIECVLEKRIFVQLRYRASSQLRCLFPRLFVILQHC